LTGHSTPEEAALADDRVPERYRRLVAVERSPADDVAVVCI
jgi:hypothetical protein